MFGVDYLMRTPLQKGLEQSRHAGVESPTLAPNENFND